MKRAHLHLVKPAAVVVDHTVDLYDPALAAVRDVVGKSAPDDMVQAPAWLMRRLLLEHDDAHAVAARTDYLERSVRTWCCALVDVAQRAGVEVGGIDADALATRIAGRVRALEVEAAWLRTQLDDAKAYAAILTGFSR